MGVGALAPWILKILAKKGCFLGFEWEKTNFATFGPPLEKFWKNRLVAPPAKILSTPMPAALLNISATPKIC